MKNIYSQWEFLTQQSQPFFRPWPHGSHGVVCVESSLVELQRYSWPAHRDGQNHDHAVHHNGQHHDQSDPGDVGDHGEKSRPFDGAIVKGYSIQPNIRWRTKPKSKYGWCVVCSPQMRAGDQIWRRTTFSQQLNYHLQSLNHCLMTTVNHSTRSVTKSFSSVMPEEKSIQVESRVEEGRGCFEGHRFNLMAVAGTCYWEDGICSKEAGPVPRYMQLSLTCCFLGQIFCQPSDIQCNVSQLALSSAQYVLPSLAENWINRWAGMDFPLNSWWVCHY